MCKSTLELTSRTKMHLSNLFIYIYICILFIELFFSFLLYSVFLSAVERCLTQPHELGKLFKKYERKLLMYVVYCQNKPVSEYLVSEHDYYFEVNCLS